MKAVFLSRGRERDGLDILGRVYDKQTQQAVADMTEVLGFIGSLEELGARRGELREVEVIFSTWGMPCLDEGEIEAIFPSLRAIFYAAGTVQPFCRPFFARGVRIFGAADANAVPVAEYTAAQILLANKGFFHASRLYRTQGLHAAREAASRSPGNYHSAVGLIGVGKIGARVARLLGRHEIEVFAFDPFLSPERAAELRVRVCPLAEMFSRCGVVSNHLANNEKTRGLLDYSLFSRLPEYGVFINTARGAQVVEDDLRRALREDPTRLAVLDVTDPEPLEPKSPWWGLENVVVTPHIAGSGEGEMARMGRMMADECRAFLCGGALEHEVTPDMLETMA